MLQFRSTCQLSFSIVALNVLHGLVLVYPLFKRTTVSFRLSLYFLFQFPIMAQLPIPYIMNNWVLMIMMYGGYSRSEWIGESRRSILNIVEKCCQQVITRKKMLTLTTPLKTKPYETHSVKLKWKTYTRHSPVPCNEDFSTDMTIHSCMVLKRETMQTFAPMCLWKWVYLKLCVQ